MVQVHQEAAQKILSLLKGVLAHRGQHGAHTGKAIVEVSAETSAAPSVVVICFPLFCSNTERTRSLWCVTFSPFSFSFFFRRNRSALTMFGICSSAAVIAFGLSNTWDVNFAFIFVYPVLLLSLEGKVER